MQIDFVIIADSAQSVGGKLYMMGGVWGQFHSQVYPVGTRASIAVGLIIGPNDSDTKQTMKVAIREVATRRLLVPEIAGEVGLGKIPAGTPSSRFSLVINLAFQIPAPGQYLVTVTASNGTSQETDFVATVLPPSQPIEQVSTETRH